MRKLASLYIFAAVSLINHTATKPSDVLQCLLNDSSFLHLPGITEKNVRLHIVASSACLKESPGVIQRFLSHASVPPRAFFTRLSAVGGHPHTCDGAVWVKGRYTHWLCVRSVILLLCGRPPWKSNLRNPPKFLTYLLVDADMESDAGRLTNDRVIREYSQEVNFFEARCSENRLFLSRNQGSVLLPLSSAGVVLFPHLEGSQALGGAMLSMRCIYYTTCPQPGFKLFAEILRSKNATVEIQRDTSFGLSYTKLKRFQMSIVPGSIIYNPAQEISQSAAVRMLYPHLTVVRFLETLDFKVFVKKPSRFPRSAVLALPLHWPVWIMLASTYAFFLVLLRAQISLRSARRSRQGSGLEFALISSMLQQSSGITFRGRNQSVRKASFGMWLILALVVSSAFKGSLTSLLKNIPLAETLHRFVSGDNGAYVGYNVAAVECTRDSRFIPSRSTLIFPAGDNSGTCFVHRLTSMSTTKTFIIANSFPQELLYIVTQELDQLGYTWVDGDVGSGLAGPAVPYTSPYKHALAKLMQTGLEAGLFQRASDWDYYKAVYERARTLLRNSSPDDGTLILSDLEPYFATLAVGMTASLIALLAELLTYHCRRCFTTTKVRCIVAKARK